MFILEVLNFVIVVDWLQQRILNLIWKYFFATQYEALTCMTPLILKIWSFSCMQMIDIIKLGVILE